MERQGNGRDQWFWASPLPLDLQLPCIFQIIGRKDEGFHSEKLFIITRKQYRWWSAYPVSGKHGKREVRAGGQSVGRHGPSRPARPFFPGSGTGVASPPRFISSFPCQQTNTQNSTIHFTSLSSHPLHARQHAHHDDITKPQPLTSS
jgi:hypothetical protein